MKITVLRRLAVKYGQYALLGLFFLVTILPILLRVTQGAPALADTDTYAHLRRAELVIDGNYGFDTLRDERFLLSPHILVLALFQVFELHWLLPIILGLAFIFLLKTYVDKRVKDDFLTFLLLAIVIISPQFMSWTTTHNPVLTALVCALGALLLFDSKLQIACILLVLAAIISPVIGMLVVVYLLLDSLAEQRTYQAISIGMVLVTIVVWYALWMQAVPAIRLQFQPQNIFLEFGIQDGISVFLLIFAGYGAFAKEVVQRKKLLLLTMGSLLLTFVQPAMALATVLPAYFAAFGVKRLFVARWNQEILRQLTLVLALCVVLFTLAVTIPAQVHAKPDAAFINTMERIGADRHAVPGAGVGARVVLAQFGVVGVDGGAGTDVDIGVGLVVPTLAVQRMVKQT